MLWDIMFKFSYVGIFQIFDGSNVPECMVDGWNAFFFNDIEDLVRPSSTFLVPTYIYLPPT